MTTPQAQPAPVDEPRRYRWALTGPLVDSPAEIQDEYGVETWHLEGAPTLTGTHAERGVTGVRS